MKTHLKEIISVVALIIISVLLFFVIKNQNKIIEKQNIIESSIVEQKQLTNSIVRAKSSYVTEEQIEKLLKENKVDLDPIKKDIDNLGAQIKGITFTVVHSGGVPVDNQPSDSVVPNTEQTLEDKYGYLNNKAFYNISETFSGMQVPVGKVNFSAWQEKPWGYSPVDREYKTIGVLSYDEDGKGYFHNKFIIKADNKEYEIKIDKAEFYQEYPKSDWRFTPRLYAGVGVGTNVVMPQPIVMPSIGMSFFSYGKTKIDPSFIFVIPGIGYDTIDKEFNGELGLVYYNLGNHLPFVDNLFGGVSVSSSFSGEFSAIFGLKFGL